MAFTDGRAFDELVRAAEGVPRNALNIAAKAALRAAERKVSAPDVRSAARAPPCDDGITTLAASSRAVLCPGGWCPPGGRCWYR